MAVLGLVHVLEGLVVVLGLVCVLEVQGEEGLVHWEKLGLVPGLEVLLPLLAPVGDFTVEGLLPSLVNCFSLHTFMCCRQFWCRWSFFCHF